MAKYILKRVVMAIITVLIVSCVTFLLMMSVPGSPFASEKALTPQQQATLDAKYGFDKSLPIQMVNYLKNALHGDLGESLKMQKGRPVAEIIADMFPISAKIGVIALAWAVVVGILLGCLAAYYRGKWVDSLLRVVCTLGISMPGFVVASFLLILFCSPVGPELLKSFELTAIFNPDLGAKAYFMPCFALGLHPMCYTARLTRSSMLDAINQEYIKTARAKGLSQFKVLMVHAVRNSIIPVVTILGPVVVNLLTGSLAVESIYSVPGIGSLFVDCIKNNDYSTIMGITVFYSAFYIFVIMVVDILYSVIDPRIRIQGSKEG